MMDVTLKNFEAEVITASMSVPVLVDFWAPWCGPCKSLGPILEKVEEEYGGRFKLVKIDTDAQPQLAQAFGIRSVPTVILLMGGQPVDGFTGAIPEGQVKAFLDKHVPSVEDMQAQANAQEADALASAGDSAGALERLQEALAINPADNETRCRYVTLLLQQGQTAAARAAWEPMASLVSAGGALGAQPAALLAWLQALEAENNAPPSLSELEKAITANKRDFDARFALAQRLLAAGERTRALDELLEIIMRDKTWHDNAARHLYVAILELMTPRASAPSADGEAGKGAIALERQAPQLDPQQKLVADYRRRLSMALN